VRFAISVLREEHLCRRTNRAARLRISLLVCSIGTVRSFPVKRRSSGISRWNPSQLSVTKEHEPSSTFSISCWQWESLRSPNFHPRGRRDTPSMARQIQTLFFFHPHSATFRPASRSRFRRAAQVHSLHRWRL
jgi:hypothetical protein